MDINFLESNRDFKEKYDELQKAFARYENSEKIYYIKGALFQIFPKLNRWVDTKEEKEFLNECKLEAAQFYQKALELNYKKIKEQKEIGIADYDAMEFWILTIDENGNPKKTTVIDVDEDGAPVYADNCKAVSINLQITYTNEYRHELEDWIERNSNLYELKKAAESLKQKGRLGMESVPSPNYDTYGMSREQSDSQAWQNYTIENGMYRPTDYDKTLDNLLKNIDKCIDFYEKAISMV